MTTTETARHPAAVRPLRRPGSAGRGRALLEEHLAAREARQQHEDVGATLIMPKIPADIPAQRRPPAPPSRDVPRQRIEPTWVQDPRNRG